MMKQRVFLFSAAFLTISLLILSLFVNFSADDFCLASKVMNEGWMKSQKNLYLNWSGRYFSTFLVFSALFFKSAAFAKIISVFSITLFLFIITMLFKKYLIENSLKSTLIFSFWFFILYISGMPSLSQGFYWLTGILTYTLPMILLMMLFSIIKGFVNDDERKMFKVPAAIALSFALIGSNEVTMLLVFLMLLFFLTYFKIFENSFSYSILLLIFAAIVFSLIVIMAPGNQIRSSQFVNNKNLFSSFLYSILMIVALLTVWMFNPLLWLLSLLYIRIRTDKKMIFQNCSIKPLFFVAIALSVGLFSTIFPSFYATNSPPPGRSLNISYLIFLFFMITLLEIGSRTMTFKLRAGFFYKLGIAFSIVFLFFHLFLSFRYSEFPTKQGDVQHYSKNIITSAEYFFKYYGRNNYADVFGDIVSGRVKNYSETMEKRKSELALCDKNSVCVVSEIKKYPRSILFRDIEDDENDWKNQCYADFYNLKSVVTE